MKTYWFANELQEHWLERGSHPAKRDNSVWHQGEACDSPTYVCMPVPWTVIESATMVYQDDPLTNWATQPVLEFILSFIFTYVSTIVIKFFSINNDTEGKCFSD